MESISLRTSTTNAWVEVALKNFNHVLVDHAACERKASAIGMSFVVRYPDRKEILDPMIRFAREELEHFHQVFRVVTERGLTLVPDTTDPYVSKFTAQARTGRDERFLDRLLIAGVIEARGTERMSLLAQHLEEPKLKGLYARLASAEVFHSRHFVDMARFYFSEETISARLDELLYAEAKIMNAHPIRAAFH